MNPLMTRLIIAAATVFALATLCSAQQATNLGDGAQFKGTTIKMKDQEVGYVLFFKAGKAVEATADGTNNTDVNLYVYDQGRPRKEVGKDDSPGPKCSVKFTPDKDGKYLFVIRNSGGENTVDFKVTVAQ